MAIGLATPLPAMSGAEPCTGSYIALRFLVLASTSPSEAEASINETEERMFLRILLAVEDHGLERLISFMSSRDMLTPSIMLRAACGGHMTIVEQALAWLAAMPGRRGNGQSLKAIHSAARIPEDCYPVMRAAFEVAAEARRESEWPSEDQFGRRVVEAILTRQEALAPLQGAKMLDLVGLAACFEIAGSESEAVEDVELCALARPGHAADLASIGRP